MRRQLLTALLALVVCPYDAVAQQDASPPANAEQARQPADRPEGPFRRLFTTLGRDLKRLPSGDNKPLLLHGALFAVAAWPMDDFVTLGASSSKILKAGFSGFGKALGREWVQGGAALAAYAVGNVWNQPRIEEAAGDLIEVQLLSVTATQALKFAVNRTRPDGEARSFPSGHASAAFATASTLERHFGLKVAIPAYAVAAYTSASRLQANSHYASDVIFGAALGIAAGRTATLELGRSRLQMSPAPVDGGFGVVFTLLHD